jgi:NAD+ synthase (glutamine-hydrolysing)
VLAAEALGKANVLPVLMPSAVSSAHSVTDAEALCERLGVQYEKIPIQGPVDAFASALAPHFKNTQPGVPEQNVQARSRAVLLMALANKRGYILLNTSNKSELAVGYGTLYGDLAGGLSVLGDVYKTDVYQLAAWINRHDAVIPESIVRKEPSAELAPGQKDSDDLPPYSVLDPILLQYIENRLGPGEIIAQGFDESTVRRVLKLVNTSEYKRFQTPPIFRVSPKAFGLGRRMPIVGRYLS